jgi:hypothetical protein
MQISPALQDGNARRALSSESDTQGNWLVKCMQWKH